MKFKIQCLFVTLLLTGCTIHKASVPVYMQDNSVLHTKTTDKIVSGEDYVSVMLVPIGIPTVDGAVANALAKDPCAVGLSNVKVTILNHELLFGTYGYRVQGNAIYDNSDSECS